MRLATAADIPQIIEMTLKFVEAAGTPEVSIPDLTEFSMGLINAENGFVCVTDKAFIAGFTAPLYYNKAHIDAHEAGWWSEDGSGLRLLDAFEKWAAEQGANDVVLSTLTTTDDRVLSWLSRKGYKSCETNHRRTL